MNSFPIVSPPQVVNGGSGGCSAFVSYPYSVRRTATTTTLHSSTAKESLDHSNFHSSSSQKQSVSGDMAASLGDFQKGKKQNRARPEVQLYRPPGLRHERTNEVAGLAEGGSSIGDVTKSLSPESITEITPSGETCGAKRSKSKPNSPVNDLDNNQISTPVDFGSEQTRQIAEKKVRAKSSDRSAKATEKSGTGGAETFCSDTIGQFSENAPAVMNGHEPRHKKDFHQPQLSPPSLLSECALKNSSTKPIGTAGSKQPLHPHNSRPHASPLAGTDTVSHTRTTTNTAGSDNYLPTAMAKSFSTTTATLSSTAPLTSSHVPNTSLSTSTPANNALPMTNSSHAGYLVKGFGQAPAQTSQGAKGQSSTGSSMSGVSNGATPSSGKKAIARSHSGAGPGSGRSKSPGRALLIERPKSPGPAKSVKLSAKQISDISNHLGSLQLLENSIVQQYLESEFESPEGANQIAQLLVQQCIEQGKAGKIIAKICALLFECPTGGVFYSGLLLSCQQYLDCKAVLRVEHFRFWHKFICFLPELFATVGMVFEGELVQLMLQCYDFMLHSPVLESLNIEELESVIACMLNAGHDLEREFPAEISALRNTLRDAFIAAPEPWARKMLLLLVELGAYGWKLPADASEYYFQSSASAGSQPAALTGSTSQTAAKPIASKG